VSPGRNSGVNRHPGQIAAHTAPMNARPVLRWRWFAAWLLVGGLYALSLLSVLTIGLFILPLPVLATVLLCRHPERRGGLPGLVAGIALPLFYVAALNRGGPGMICSSIDGGSGTMCTEETSPWPWLAAGVLLLTLGTVAFWLTGRKPPDSPLAG
jgi:hypothetical protein